MVTFVQVEDCDTKGGNLQMGSLCGERKNCFDFPYNHCSIEEQLGTVSLPPYLSIGYSWSNILFKGSNIHCWIKEK